MVFTGAFVYLQWATEAIFNTKAVNLSTTAGQDFGFEQKITSWSFTNNKIPLAQLNDVRIKTYAYGQTRGSLSVDFVLSDPGFLELVGFKNVSVSGAGPYVHTWCLDTTADTKIIQSFSTEIGQCAGATDIVRTLTGGIVNSATITATIGEVARVSLDSNYANESLTTALDACLNPLCVTDAIPFTFAHGSLEFPDCTVIAETQDVELTFSQNSDHLWGIGTSVAASAYRKLFEITGSFKTSFTDSVQLQKLYAQQKDTLCNTAACAETLLTEQPTLKLTFTNGLCGTAERSIEFSITGIALADHNLSIEPNEPVFEELNFQASDCTAVANNNVAIIPADAS